MNIPIRSLVVMSCIAVLAVGGPGTLSANTIPRAEWRAKGVRLIQASDSVPPLTSLGAVSVHRRGTRVERMATWQPVYDSLATRVRARGGNLLLWVSLGEDEPRDDDGYTRWAIGIAARSLPAPVDSLPPPTDCVAEWLPLEVRVGDSTTVAEHASLDRRAFELARLMLGDRGFYLVSRRDSSAAESLPWTDPVSGADTRGLGPAALWLQAGVSRQTTDPGAGATGARMTLTASLRWKTNDAALWENHTSWFSADSGFAFMRGTGSLATRAALLGLFQSLWSWERPPDSDGDGVPDNRDRQPRTPSGVQVNYEGVALDDDGDGVPNSLDRDPRTRPGSLVDQWGVSIDRDHDGVDDNHDQCPDTPAGRAVDDHGCEIVVAALEDSLLDTGRITEQSIHFETGQATLLASSFARLDLIGQTLSGMPELRFEISGYCDDRGADEVNQALSEARAAAVLDYLVIRFPDLSRSQFTTQGYGKTRPRMAGTDERARAMNRRVEFLVLNPELARRQVLRKRYLNRGEQAPAEARRR
jgi:outer membrane protein OmpA-like peptidoglycan-associated protein